MPKEKVNSSDTYIMIPREIIEDNTIPPERVLVFMFLSSHITRSCCCDVGFSREKLAAYCFLRVSNKFCADIQKIINSFIKDEIVSETEYSGSYSHGYYDLWLNKTYFSNFEQFALIRYDELKILWEQFKKKRQGVSFTAVINTLACIRVNTWRRNKYGATQKERPEICKMFLQEIADTIQVSKATVKNAIHLLKKCGCIEYQTVMKVKCGKPFTFETVFVDRGNPKWEEELRLGIEMAGGMLMK